MAMLAERRRKQKWSLNPRGKYWSEDSNKFGQKLLEKMGWSAGKGLGANEDGITEHVKVSYKNDSKGMGFKETDDQWTEHESNFSQLLNSLPVPSKIKEAEIQQEIKIESLEKKSQNSRARVHYHKFTRGKDLSRYSEKDLANIFGKKSLKESKKIEVNKEVIESKDIDEKSYGIQTHNGGSMLDYFRNKLPNYKKYTVNSEKDKIKGESDSENERPSFGFGFKNGNDSKLQPSFTSYIQENNKMENNSEVFVDTKKKKKSKKEKIATDEMETNEQSQNNLDENERKVIQEYSANSLKRKFDDSLEIAFTPVKKKFRNFENLSDLADGEKIEHTPKKSKTKRFKRLQEKNGNACDELDNNGTTNPAFDPMFNKLEIERHSLTVIQEEDENVQESTIENVGELSNIKKLKKKKEKSKQTLTENDSLDDNSSTIYFDKITQVRDEISTNSVENLPPQKKPRKFKKKREDGIGDTSFNENLNNGNFDAVNTEKNNSTERKEKHGSENTAFNENLANIVEPEKIDKKSKKKKNKENGIENTAFNESLNNEDTTESHCVILEKKYKRKKRKEEIGIENIAFNESLDTNENDLETIGRVEKTKKKPKEENEVNNSTFNESPKDSEITGENIETVQKEKKNKRKKITNGEGIVNPCFKYEISVDTNNEEEPSSKKKNKKKKHSMIGKENDSIPQEEEVEKDENFCETASKPKKRKKKETVSMDNLGFSMNDSMEFPESSLCSYEVKRKKKEANLGIANPALELATPSPNGDCTTNKNENNGYVELEMPILDNTDVMLNVVNTPVLKKKDEENSRQKRKNVRFIDTTQKVFNNNVDRNTSPRKYKHEGIDNSGYDQLENSIEENIDSLSKKLDDYQAEVENDINEAKMEIMVGEMGDPNGENEILPNGDVKLKFKYSNFGKAPPWMKKNADVNRKTSYRHLIKGDIILGFKNTNLHEISGYKHKKI